MSKRVLIWGAGAIGGTAGAYLTRAGHHVTLVDVSPEHVAVMRDPAQGLRISGPVENFQVVANAFRPEELTGTWAVVLLSVKAQLTSLAATMLKSHLAPEGCVVSLQNGLCEDIIAQVVGRERTLGCFVNYAADVLSPGHIQYGQRGYIAVGELDGRMTERARAVVKLLRDFEPESFLTDSIASYLWSKLVFSALLFGTAVCASPMVPLLEDRSLLGAWRALCGEVVAVAGAQGIKLKGFDGFEPGAFAQCADPEASWGSLQALLIRLRPSTKSHSGCWRDIAINKRQSEIMVQLQPLLEVAEAYHVPCPTLHKLARLVGDVEGGLRPQDDANARTLLPEEG